MQLDSKIAIVTGGGAGIGRAIAMSLARAGAHVVLADLRMELATETAQELGEMGLSASAFEVDITRADQVKALVDSVVNSRGAVDILVNNAGIGQHSTLLETTEETWDSIMSINLKGAFLCSKAVALEMVRRGNGGRIINTVSTAAENARVGAAAYCASKAGLVQFTRVLALELGPHGITVNAVGPGMTLTGSPVRAAPTEEYRRAFVGQVPLGRAGSPEDVAKAVAFLVSADADYINGQVIYVDGGYSAGKMSVRD